MSVAIVIFFVLFLVVMSGIFSGLNVALMALDQSDLERKAKLGNKQARIVMPLRKNTHLSLASILLVNIATVSAASLVLAQVVNGWIAGCIATLLIVIFGEVLPQALFSNTPLKYVAKFSWLLSLMIILSYPISKPLQLLLDRLFPRRRGAIQTRDELGLLIGEHLTDTRSELDDDEVVIIRGALQLSEKRVRSIMTPISKTFWLTPDQELTDAVVDEIKDSGFSRIPVFDSELNHCYGILIMKRLVDIDFDDVLYKVSDLNLHPASPIGGMMALDTLFRKFITKKTHLLPVEKDDKIIGIVSIEDLLEEIIGHEIEDESD